MISHKQLSEHFFKRCMLIWSAALFVPPHSTYCNASNSPVKWRCFQFSSDCAASPSPSPASPLWLDCFHDMLFHFQWFWIITLSTCQFLHMQIPAHKAPVCPSPFCLIPPETPAHVCAHWRLGPNIPLRWKINVDVFPCGEKKNITQFWAQSSEVNTSASSHISIKRIFYSFFFHLFDLINTSSLFGLRSRF